MAQILRKNQTLMILIVFIVLFLSNFSAFFAVLWLVPDIVFALVILFLLAAAFLVWFLYKEKLLGTLFSRLKRNWFIFPFLLFSLASVIWSIQKDISIYRWVIFLCTILIGGFIGVKYSMREILKIFSLFSLLILFLSLLILVIIPEIGIMNYYIIQGAWKGIFWHKNHMGLFATFSNMLFLFNLVESIRTSKQSKYVWGAAYLLSLIFVIYSDSVAAYISTIFLHGVFFLLLLWIKIRDSIKPKHYVVFVVLIVLAAVVLALNLDMLFGLFNRNTTMTGRIPMWNYLFETYFSKRPFLGYGFNAFWYLNPHRVDLQQAAGYPDPIVIADNGFIDILINTGYVGLFLFGILYLGMWYRSFQLLKNARSGIDLLPIVIMAFSLISNISWSLIFENEGYFMLLMMIVLFMHRNSNFVDTNG